MTVQYKYFSSSTKSWDALFAEAAEFASHIEPAKLISTSHSHGSDHMLSTGVITAWYWA